METNGAQGSGGRIGLVSLAGIGSPTWPCSLVGSLGPVPDRADRTKLGQQKERVTAMSLAPRPQLLHLTGRLRTRMRANATTRRWATPGNGCTNGCSPPGGGTSWSASPAAAAASTTPSPSCTVRGSAPRSWVPGSSATPGWHEDPQWTGWWGPNPPFHTPTFVLTHHPRPSIEMEGGTTFHFLDASPAEALEAAREAAGGQDVRIGGGPTVIRDFLAAGLDRPPARRGGPDPARPRRPALGRPGGPRGGLPGRGHLLAQRRHPRDVHPYRSLNRLGEADGTPVGGPGDLAPGC